MPTSSLLVERLGAQVPVIQHLPPDVASLDAAEEAIELADAYGICDGFPLAESQKTTLRAGLGERADGSWAASRIADFGPRQGTGKNDKIAARELAGLILFGEKLIIHTAHEFPTANESFLRLVAVFENYDDLRKKVARIRYANGEQGIELLSGQRLKYRARTGGSGRGFAKADLLVYDEAQHLGREHVAASGPSKLANPNSQTWYAGSGGLATSAVAWAIRRAALLGDGGRLAYTEMTAETIAVYDGRFTSKAPDPLDRDVWYRTIPGLGRWVTEEGVEALYDELGHELFLREILCVWDPEPRSGSGGAIPLPAWMDCQCPADEPEWQPVGPPVFAVDVDVARSMSIVAMACWRPDGRPQVEIAATGEGTAWVLPWLAERRSRYGRKMRAVYNSRGPAKSLAEDAEALGVPYESVNSSQMVQSCGQFFDDITVGALRHLGDPILTDAVALAETRTMGDAWVWDLSLPVGALSAATLARGALPPFEKPQPRVVNLAAALAAANAQGE